MNHLKKIGLLVAAVAALMAVGVASASAAEFHSSVAPTSLSGAQEGTHKFTTEGSTVTCSTATFEGTIESSTSETQSAHPAYSGCTAFGFAGATVNTAGCDYDFNANSSNVDLSGCTAGHVSITVETIFNTKCVVYVPNQTGINGISFENMSPKTTFTVNAAANNIEYEVITSTGLCPLEANGSGNDAEYSGLTAITGGSGAEIWRE